MSRIRVAIQPEDFDCGVLTRALSDDAGITGAVTCFVGTVRADGDVLALSLQHYPGMSEKSIERIAEQAAARWQLTAISIVHRVGRLEPGEQIVYAGAASAHRGDALEACAFIADQLKTRAVLWKKEHTPSGERWLEPTEADSSKADAWHD